MNVVRSDLMTSYIYISLGSVSHSQRCHNGSNNDANEPAIVELSSCINFCSIIPAKTLSHVHARVGKEQNACNKRFMQILKYFLDNSVRFIHC